MIDYCVEHTQLLTEFITIIKLGTFYRRNNSFATFSGLNTFATIMKI